MSIWAGGNQGTDGGWGPTWKVYRKTTEMSNPGPAKAILAMMGVIQEEYRLPLVAMEPKNREIVRKTAIDAGLIKA